MRIKISHLIKFCDSFKGIEVHIFVGGKYIKLNYSEDQFIEILRKLQQKDVEEVYIQPDDCNRLMKSLSESMAPDNFYDPYTLDEDKLINSEVNLQVVKQVIKQFGVDAETLKLLTTINKQAMALLSESPSIFAFIKRFRSTCSEEYLRAILTSYLMSLVVDKFDWKSDQVKEKGALASMLCDMILEKEDFHHLREWEQNGTLLPDHIKNHPIEVISLLQQKRNVVPRETLTIIEQHHELPNGKGFPHGIAAGRFNQLSCIFILSQQFIEKLFDTDFDFEKKLEIIRLLQLKYESRNFDRALDALISVVDS